mgnify:CR=1 FL=1
MKREISQTMYSAIDKEIVPILKDFLLSRLKILILNEFEKNHLQDSALYGYKDFVKINQEIIASNSSTFLFAQIFERYVEDSETHHSIFLNRHPYDVMIYELLSYGWWQVQRSDNYKYRPNVKYFRTDESVEKSFYFKFYNYLLRKGDMHKIEELMGRYNLSALLSLYSIEDYFVDLYILTSLVVNSKSLNMIFLIEQLKNIMHLLPFNRLSKFPPNYEILNKQNVVMGDIEAILRIDIPINKSSDIVDLFHQLSVQLSVKLINLAIENKDNLLKEDSHTLSDLSALMHQIKQTVSVSKSLSTLQKEVDSPYLLAQNLSLPTALFLLLYRFYIKKNPEYSVDSFMKYVSDLFNRRGYENEILKTGITDQHTVVVSVKNANNEKDTKIKIIYGSIRSKKNDYQSDFIKTNKLDKDTI